MKNIENYISPKVEIIESQILYTICVAGSTNEEYNNQDIDDRF